MTYSSVEGAPRESWGTYCQHGKQLTEPDPESPTYAYPTYRLVSPWPCDVEGCTPEALEEDAERERAECLAEREREYHDMVAGGIDGPGAGDWR